MSQSMKKRFPSITSIDLESDGNTSFLRAARNGQLDKVLEHLKSNIDINTSNSNGLNALHLASKDGHVEIVKELLKRGALVDSATKKGNTALHIASLAGQEEVVKLLVQNGATVNVQSQNGFTPLYMAAQENHDNVVRYLLANGANQSLSTEDGFTPLAVAMQQGHDKVVTVLLENDTRGKVRLPALHIAAKKDDVKAAKLLLENEHNPDVTSKSGFTPLHIASHYGNQKIAKLLIQKGADVNYAAKHNITPLHVAAKWGKSNMVALLLENGATIEAKTRDGLTPLHCAARSGHEQVVDMLLEKDAPISSKTKNGLAPLHMAAQGDHVDAARILLYHRAPVDEVTVDYLTALHVAAHCGHVRVAKLLLDRQADANARALNGFTPLHIACKKNRIKVVELLLKHGASIGATTESGLTPLHVASFMGCMNIVIYLLQHDANPDAPTIRGETPLHLAARANQTDIIRILLRNGAQVDARAREQQTPLHIASRLGNVDIVMLLLQHGSKVDNATKDMYTALHIAAKEGQDEVAGVLIDNGASINSTTKKGFTPLHLASKYGNLKVAKLLLQKEAPVDAQGKNGVTPLHVASHYDHQNVALLLLDKGASPHATAKNGHTPLHIAARKNQMDIANTLLEYGAQPNAESKAGFTPLHLSSQEGHVDISSLLLEHKADPNHEAKNGLTPLHLCAQEDKVPVAEVLVKNGAHVDASTKAGYTPLHIACHYGQTNMVRFLLRNGAEVKSSTSLGYTPLHQAAQQGHTNIVNILLESNADPNAVTTAGQTPLNIAQKLGYITVIESLKLVTTITNITTTTTTTIEEKYRVQAPEAMQETFMSDSEEEGGEDAALGDQTYRYLTADEMKSLGDDSLPIDVTRDERMDSNKMIIDSNMLPPQHIEDSISPEHVSGNYTEYIKKYTSDNIDINRHPINIGFLVSFLVDARGGAMRGCRHSGVRVIVPPRCAPSPTRITCRYVRPQRTPHPPPLMEGEALASRVLELGPVGAQFLGPVIIEVPHFAALRGKEREIVILRSDNGESWKEHTVNATEDILNEVLHESFEEEDLNQMEDLASGRITRIVTQDFPQYFAVVSRIRQEVHAIGPEGGMVSSSVVPQVQAIFPEGALTKKIKVGLQAQPIDPELTAKLLGHGVAVSPVVTVEPRRRKFHRAIQLNMPAPTAHSQGMINQYSGSAPTLRLLCSITGGTSRAQWEDVTGSTPLTFVNDVVSFTTTVSARFWLIDCRNISDATKMATELYKEAIHVPFMAKFVVFAKRVDPLEARLRLFCMTDDKEDKTLEHQEHFTEVAKSRDVEVLEGKSQYIEFAGNLVPITKSGEQLQFSFRAFRENRLPFSVRVKDQHAEAVGRCLFMREAKILKGEPPQQPICILNIVLPDDIVTDTISLTDSESGKRHMYLSEFQDYYRPDPRLADMSNLLGEDWVELAYQLGLTSSEINVIKSEYPESIAKQAQSMLRMWLSQSGNKAQTTTLENALRRIGREDIIPQCLNVEQPTHTFNRIKEQEIGYRLKKKDENDLADKKKIEHYDKYSAEEKVVEKSESEEDDNFDKTVTERREKIEKRLSAERAIPASSQRREIVQEICDIKRQSLVEDKIAEVLQKVEPETKIKADVRPQISETTDIKTTLPSSSVISETTTAIVQSHKIVEDTATHKPGEDARFLEAVSSRFEGPQVKIEQRVSSNDDPKSPNFSKTPPPSPADFLIQRQVASAQDWDSSRKPADTTTAPLDKDAAQQEVSCGLTHAEPSLTSTTIVSSPPQPKPRASKPDIPLDFSKALPKTDKILSPVRDDLLDQDESDLASYSDRKTFWENVSKDKTQKRLSLHELSISDKQVISRKRISIHEITQPPIPKPRSAFPSTEVIHQVKSDEIIIAKGRTDADIKLDQAIEAENAHAQQELTSIIEGIESEDKHERVMTEYQASFLPPSERKELFKVTEKSQQSYELEKDDSLDSDKAQKGSSQLIENTGYISDSEDVENVISDSEIEDRVPQIRERQMSVFAPSVTQRKSIYERSASLPTEDLYEVSRNLKQLKEKYEQKIREDLIEEHFVGDNDEECSPERKTLATMQEKRVSIVKSYVDEAKSKINEESFIGDKSFVPIRSDDMLLDYDFQDTELKHEVEFSDDIVSGHDNEMAKISVKELAKSFDKQLSDDMLASKSTSGSYAEESSTSATTEQKDENVLLPAAKKSPSTPDIQKETANNFPTCESDSGILSDGHGYESSISKESMEVHVDKSELEESEKTADNELDTHLQIKTSKLVTLEQGFKEPTEEIPEITVTLSGKQRRISEDSDDYSDKITCDKTDEPAATSKKIPEHMERSKDEKSASKQHDEHVQSILWEAAVETQPNLEEEKVGAIVDLEERTKVAQEFICTEKTLGEKQVLISDTQKSEKIDIDDQEGMTSIEEDEYTQVEHIVKRQSVTDFDKLEEQFKDSHTDAQSALTSIDKSIPDISKIKENISEKLTKELHEKLSEKVKSQDIIIEKAVSEEVDDKTLDDLKELMVEEAFEELQQQKSSERDKTTDLIHNKGDELTSCGVPEESEFGSEIHMDYSDSCASERIKSESHSEIEKIILDTFQHMKVDPDEARKIASKLIEEIENELQNRGELSKSEASEQSKIFDPELSTYIKQLAETNGLDEREVELVESVLARRQRELAKLARGDTQASSMEITDEDLRYSGSELADYTNTLEQQIGQLEAEKINDVVLEYKLQDRDINFHEKTESFEKFEDKHSSEQVFSEGSDAYDDPGANKIKKDLSISVTDNVKGERNFIEHKNVILEEDETISESSTEDHSKIKIQTDALISEVAVTKTDEKQIHSVTSGLVSSESNISVDVQKDVKDIKSDKIEEVLVTDKYNEQESSSIVGQYTADRSSIELIGDVLKEESILVDRQYKESVQQEQIHHKERLSKTETLDSGAEISTKIITDKQHFISSSEVVIKDKSNEKIVTTSSKVLEGTDLVKLLDGDEKFATDSVVSKGETIHRGSSSESKSSADSGKSPDKRNETFGKEHVVLRKSKSEVDISSSSSNLKPDRRSAVELEAYSSSGESHYQSFEMDSAKSRPCSSDVEGIVAAASSEYETALTSTQEYSTKSHFTSADYHTAISSLSSKESMKSLDSESSGNLASVEVSEHSETLVPSSSDMEGDILEFVDQQILEDGDIQFNLDKHGKPGRQVSDLTDSDIANESIDISEDDQNELDGNAIDGMSKMKRSAEMTFQPEPKILVPESAQLVINDLDEKYGQSLDEGSILSASVSSTSSTGAQRTVIEISERNDGSMAVSGISEHHSLEDNEQTIRGSQESLPLTPTLHKSCDMSTSTPQVCAEMPIDQVTITTSSVREYGIHSASTQITSETREYDENTITKVSLDEPRRKGHRRTESTVIGISLPSLTLDSKLKESLTDENKERNICESEKDIDEKEETQKAEALSNKEDIELTRPQSSFSKSDARNTVESEIEDIIQSDIIDTTDPFEGPLSPEPHDLPKYNFSGVSMVNASDLESQFSPRLKESIEVQRKWSTSSSISDTSKEILDKRDSHGKSSVTSSEKSSFEEAEAEAAFNMVAHISPAHKVKQIIPILEDEDAEKRELELREKQRKELDRKRAEMRDKSPGFIPDITVTDMTPESDHEDQSEDEEIKPYEQESSDVSQDAHGPSENIIEGSALIQECIKEDLENDSEQGLLQDPIQHDIITSSMMQSTLIDSVVTESNTTELTTVLERPASTSQSEVDSQSSDSFEMLEKPDIIEDFVVIEEVAKEAQEFDTEGQSVKIDKSAKKVKKHDEEIERYLAHSAPTPLTGTHTVVDEFGFEFEDSPPKPDGNGAVASTREYGYEYDRELEANKKWIEQQFQGDQAAMLAAGYGYEMEFERGPLEDIKEEDINDFAASSYGSQKESGGSLGSVKDSYSSTPDYDVLAGRKYFTRSGEQDDISMSSLQEFENLEQAMSLEMRKFHQGQNSDSSSSGSSKTRFHHGKNNVGDDISVNSLKEFEGLEHACIQAHKIEVKAKEEEALLAQIEEGQESIASESESCETAGTEKKALDTEDDEDYEKRMFEIDEIIKQAQTNVERFIDLREIEKTESLGRGDSLEEVSKVPDLEHDNIPVKSTIKVQWKESDDVMIASTDSLDFRQEDEERRDSADSLDAPPVVDIMTASTDSIEFQLKSAKEAVMTDSIEIRDERRDMVSSDSLELGQATSSGLNVIQTDSIEDDGSRTGGHDHSSASTGRDFSSSAREEAFIDHDFAKEDPMLRSIESVDPTSSTATHATMQYETDSVFSGSFTSGGSNTMVSSTDTVDPVQYKETVNVAAAVRKVWFDEDLSGRRTTDYVEDSTPFVSETIEPVDDNDFSHIIHRKVELPPEVHRITFTGQDADEQLQRYMQNFDDGEDVQETQEVDEYGNIHTKRVVRKKFIVKGGEGEHPMTAEDIEDYFRELNKPEVVQDRGIITRSGAKGVFTQEVLDGNESTKTSFTQKIDVPSSGYASLIRPGEEQAHLMDLQQGPSSSVKAESEEAQEKSERDKTRKVTDQHQLSEEMKELLKDLEKESKH